MARKAKAGHYRLALNDRAQCLAAAVCTVHNDAVGAQGLCNSLLIAFRSPAKPLPIPFQLPSNPLPIGF